MFKKFINYITNIFRSSKVETPIVEEKVIEEAPVVEKKSPKKRVVKTKTKK